MNGLVVSYILPVSTAFFLVSCTGTEGKTQKVAQMTNHL